ncbi:MAG: alkaline phosphatase family protein [Rhizobiaceae bacterium]
MKPTLFIVLAVLLVAANSLGASAIARDKSGIKMVLQITVDGLRSDLLTRYAQHFGEGGFAYLLNNGVHYPNAHYKHANTETIVGHTTLSTGAHPSEHGMVGNVIFDRKKGELAYNIEDADAPILPTRDDAADGAQVDPAQKRSRSQGRSPGNIKTSTFADELSIHTSRKAKIFGVSGKDRSAIAMAGHSGKAFWFSTDTGDFQTSKYYYDAYPDWAAEWNGKRKAEVFAGKAWELPGDLSTYLNGDRDDRPFETDLKGYGRVFPHAFGQSDHPLFATRILVSSVGDQLTADFAKTIIDAEALGKDDAPDYLSVSFSGVDAVNHFFGPSSVENEAVVRDLDATIADLLEHIDRAIGLNNVVIVLSADHGTPEAPEYASEYGMSVGRIDSAKLQEIAMDAAEKAFGHKNLIVAFFRPYIYLNQNAISRAGLDKGEVEAVVGEAVSGIPGIARTLSRSELPNLQGTNLVERVRNNNHPDNSGDIYVVQEPFWYLQEGGAISVMHGSPWSYDTNVPILFAGPGIEKKTVNRLVHPVNVAPTLSAILGTKVPSAAFATPLVEVVDVAR